jgi:hypothetical protein
MPAYFVFGKRRNDFGLMVDFHEKRAIVRANTTWVEGVPLEEIPDGRNGFAPAMVLIRAEWKEQYFLKEREGWTDDDYFELAQKRMAIHGIRKP